MSTVPKAPANAVWPASVIHEAVPNGYTAATTAPILPRAQDQEHQAGYARMGRAMVSFLSKLGQAPLVDRDSVHYRLGTDGCYS
jgi:hypothetical protein